MGPTDPNRYHIWTGWLGNDGSGFGPVITNAEAGYNSSTFPERLQQAGITWKVYQDVGVGLDAAGFWGWTGDKPYIGNFGDNSLLYFLKYQAELPGNPLADRAKTGTNALSFGMNPDRLFDIFRQDVQSGSLPQVSYIAAPEAFSEHPNWAPNFGAWYISQIIDILVANPAVFSKTVLFIHYDEEGGFFDHDVPPTPPQSSAQGLSTVSTVNEIYTAGGGHPSGPYGLGMRVPMLVISPWSKGGWVNSQVFDHTSLIQFIEKRFPNVGQETNITPWRRAVAGDLTTAFDFANPHSPTDITLPSTASFKPTDFSKHPDYNVNAHKNADLQEQEEGVRPSRALPYALNAHGVLQSSDNSFRIDFTNTGNRTAVFQVRSAAVHQPRTYTVEPGKSLTDAWQFSSLGIAVCDLSVYAPNGFYRHFKGAVSSLRSSQLDITPQYAPQQNGIVLVIRNLASSAAAVKIVDKYTGQPVNLSIGAGATQSPFFSLVRSSGWYDFVVTVASDSSIEYRIAGRLETGKDSVSDPRLSD
jgi:phospholipase C